MSFAHYKSFVFDCDGVLLDSNRLKTEAFYEAALPWGQTAAEDLVAYHQARGGVSRFVKFEYLFETLLSRSEYGADLQRALERYGQIVREKLFESEETPGMRAFLDSLPPESYKIVVSGGMQSELREVFAAKGLDRYFHGIYGSPDTKMAILDRQREAGVLADPGILFGDSQLDYEAACHAQLDFVFLHGISEFKNWQDYFADRGVQSATHLGELLERS
jgi:phosphoglycolate phosphatase-like HAD superfamily hydrolase